MTKIKSKNLEKIAERMFKIFIITAISILFLASLYGSVKWIHNYFTMNDEQICGISDSTLINGQCHYESNILVSDRRNIMLIGGIGLSIFAVLVIFYLMILLKTKFKEK